MKDWRLNARIQNLQPYWNFVSLLHLQLLNSGLVSFASGCFPIIYHIADTKGAFYACELYANVVPMVKVL